MDNCNYQTHQKLNLNFVNIIYTNYLVLIKFYFELYNSFDEIAFNTTFTY